MTDQGAFWEPAEQPSRGCMLPAASVEWSTPGWIYRPLHAEFAFTVDVAASDTNALCKRYYTRETNGLLQDWHGERVWCNPPFDAEALQAFTSKAWQVTREDHTALATFLVPVKADQRWWHRYAIRSEVRFIPGRVAFGDARYGGPMACAIVIMSQRHPSLMTSFVTQQTALAGVLDDEPLA